MNIDIQKIAKLARLKIEEKDLPHVTKKMMEVIESIENLPSLSDEDASLNSDDAMILRKDEAKQSYNRKELLKNAPHVQSGCIVVPKTVE